MSTVRKHYIMKNNFRNYKNLLDHFKLHRKCLKTLQRRDLRRHFEHRLVNGLSKNRLNKRHRILVLH